MTAAVTDIRLSVGFFDDIKIRRLQAIHGAEGVCGLLRLWLYTAQHKPLGFLDGINDEDIPWITECHAPEFLESLLKLDLMRRDADNSLFIANWEKNQQWVVDAPKRSEHAKKAARSRWEGRAKEEKTNG